MPTQKAILCICVVMSLLLSGCASLSPHINAMPPLIPTRQFVADWHASGGYQISPDGRKLMWVARLGFGPGLYVKNLVTGSVERYKIPGSGIWARDSRHILLHIDHNGNEISHVWALDTASPNGLMRDLTPFEGAKSFVITQLPHSDDLIIGSNKRDAKVFDVYRYVQDTQALQLLATNPGNVDKWLVNGAGEVMGRARSEAGDWVYETPDAYLADNWSEIFRVRASDTFEPLRESATTHHWWALSNRDRDKSALVEIDLRNGTERVVHADGRVDLSSVVWSRTRQIPIAVTSEPDTQQWQVFDPVLKKALTQLQAARDARITIHNLSDDERWMVATVVRQNSGEHVLYDLQTHTWVVLNELVRSRLNAISPLAPSQPVHFKSRDGLDLHGYLSVPSGATPPFATVLSVHGGPWSRDVHLSGDTMELFLVNRGYAVLRVNYRGSSGYGKAFQEAARGEFAGKMHTDLIDAVDALVTQGLVDPKRIAIAGASYGGYASLVGMTFTPGKFVCGISTAGMSDIASLLSDAPPYWELGKTQWIRFVGNPDVSEQRADMQARSPLYKAAQVQGPLLLMHGVHDPRVKVSQSIKMAQALEKEDKQVRVHLFAQAGHGLTRWQDNLKAYRLTEDFLADCLGGRSGGFDLFELGSWLP
jgi:dipeptidyl aminopeptidase/acylaminoacyl peptidase